MHKVTRIHFLLFIIVCFTAYVGQTVVLTCRPNIRKDVDWKYRPSVTGFEDYVYSNGKMYERFRDRMRVVVFNVSDYRYDLIISNVGLIDSGLYICIEDLGLDARHITELIVSGKLFPYLLTGVVLSNGDLRSFEI